MSKNLRVQIITLILALLLISTAFPNKMQAAPPIVQKTLIVDISGNGDFTKINDAINNANITDIILIRKGTYNEHDLTIGKKISIVGEDPINTTINCSGNIAFTVTSSYVDISNLQIINTGEFAITIQIESTGCTITNCIINTLNKGVAIDIRSSYNTISGCNLIGFDNSKQGVKIHGSYNIVKNCDIQDFSNGVLIILNSNNNQIINCNIINNENAIDIRANSNNNIINGNNIYSNLQSVKIWDNSNNNHVYLNNFWKNDIDAIDEGNNTWDNGAEGNYWDKYRGVDANGDRIGDTPYIISFEKTDRYPLISFILPDIITYPSNVKVITSKSDNTPSFTWSSSIYSKEIKGYYLKIDNDAEQFLGNVNTWTTTKTQLDGVHKFYIRAESIDNKTSNYTIITFYIDTSIIDTDDDGWSDQEERQYGTDPNNPDNYPSDIDGDHIPDLVDTDDDNDGYSDEIELSYDTNPLDPDSYLIDTDRDGIPNNDSPDGKYKGDEDDDDDGLTDPIETEVGTNPINALDVNRIYIAGEEYYLLDITQNEIYDILYNPVNKDKTAVEKQNNSYYIDINGDTKWDYIYNIADGSIISYIREQPLSPIIWVLSILAVIILIIFIIVYYIKKQKLTIDKLIKKPERVIEKPLAKKKIEIPTIEKRDTIEMIGQTKTLLQRIQQDVEVYMEKLREIEEQFIVPPLEVEKQSKIVNLHEIEARVDEILLEFEKKEKNETELKR
jgi:nitrous oxidase accessory protein